MSTLVDHETGTAQPVRVPRLPPRWFIRSFWAVHRAVYSVTRGRFGLRTATPDSWGMLRLKTVGRRTGRERSSILGYVDDGRDIVLLAMNGWADPEPAWWLNLQAQPDAVVELPDGRREVTARASVGAERDRLWARFLALKSSAFTDASAALRSRETAIVVLEPRRRGASVAADA